MPQRRFFINTPFIQNGEVELSEEEGHHLAKVMRIQKGELVELVNGRSELATASVQTIEKRAVRLQIVSIEKAPPPSFSIILCQALPRVNRLDMILEKGVELGMTEIRLFPGALSEKKEVSPTLLQRMNTIVINAMKQCGRLDLPSVRLMPPLLKWSRQDLSFPAFYGDLDPAAPLFRPAMQEKGGLLFFVGPESGFSAEEKKFFLEKGVQAVRLHPNILRTDTASLMALSIIQYHLMLFKNT